MASEPRLPAFSVASETLSQPNPAKWKMVSRMDGVMMFDKGIQLKRCAKHFRERMHVSSALLSRGRKGRAVSMGGACMGVPAVMVMVGMRRVEVGVAKGEEAAGRAGRGGVTGEL